MTADLALNANAKGGDLTIALCIALAAVCVQTRADDSAKPAGRPKPCAPRAYPAESLKAREQGTTWVKITIVRDGTLIKAEVVRSSGHPRLDAAALEHVKTCKFMPGKVEGVRTLTMRYRWDPEGR